MKRVFWSKLIINSDKGQITIFFATSVLILITFLAFIINVGVFVKAKINLQNAADASAYAGASVQARQLTDIAYLNWEMRNVYKEWMFKYYILGGLNLKVISEGPNSMVNSHSNFTMGHRYDVDLFQGGKKAKDSYNFPSVCIDFANTGAVGLCTRYQIPGLPRFSSSNVLGMDQTTNAFMDSIVSEKAKDCSRRSKLNFFTANAWAYHIEIENDASIKNISAKAPEIALKPGGAFPRAFELALRIRNMEARVNRQPESSSICYQEGLGVNCGKSISAVLNETENSVSAERISKAFWSGFRNIGSEGAPQMRQSYTLTELKPTPFRSPANNSLSNLLIPENSPALNKYYLDLKLMPINYATFYTAFTTNEGGKQDVGNSGISANIEAQCTATKIGLPVPGYPLGFVKNQEALTYYAIKAEAKFVGLFNPFNSDYIELTAYSAAKPFGGRIGPNIFQSRDETKLFPRSNLKSSPYISALDTSRIVDQFGDLLTDKKGQYVPGAPLPLNSGTGDSKFWLTNNDTDGAIGGWVSGKDIYFGIPNLPYDYPTPEDIKSNQSYTGVLAVEIIDPTEITKPQAGLYNKEILEKLRMKLPGVANGVVRVSTDTIEDALTISKAPTLYDMANYLIPTHENHNLAHRTDSFGMITAETQRQKINANGESYTIYNARIYAPIISSESIYSNNNLTQVLSKYISNLSPAIKKYVSSMNLAAAGIYQTNSSAATNQNTGVEAAQGISDIPEAILASPNQIEIIEAIPSCKSIAGQFSRFLLGTFSDVKDGEDCVTPLAELMTRKWVQGFPSEYIFTYALSDSVQEKTRIFSAYRPGPVQGATEDGVIVNPLSDSGANSVSLRNYYSTKFIPFSAMTSSGAYYNGPPIVSEGSYTTPTLGNKTFRNTLSQENLDVDLNTIKH